MPIQKILELLQTILLASTHNEVQGYASARVWGVPKSSPNRHQPKPQARIP